MTCVFENITWHTVTTILMDKQIVRDKQGKVKDIISLKPNTAAELVESYRRNKSYVEVM